MRCILKRVKLIQFPFYKTRPDILTEFFFSLETSDGICFQASALISRDVAVFHGGVLSGHQAAIPQTASGAGSLISKTPSLTSVAGAVERQYHSNTYLFHFDTRYISALVNVLVYFASTIPLISSMRELHFQDSFANFLKPNILSIYI